MLRYFKARFILHPKFNKARQHPFQYDTMEIGNLLKLFLPLILIHLVSSSSSSSPSSLRGGLVYSEEFEQGPIYTNPQTYTVLRTVDTSLMHNLITFTSGFASMYEGQCSKTAENHAKLAKEVKQQQAAIDTFKPERTYFVCLWNTPLFKAEHICKICDNHQGLLPEIRTAADREEIRKMAIEHNITMVPAGVKFDSPTRRFRYVSDLKDFNELNPFPYMEYGGSHGMNTWHRGQNHNDYTIRTMASDFIVIYSNPVSNFIVRIASHDELEKFPQRTICQFPITTPKLDIPKKNEETLLSLVTHSCERDKTSLVASAKAAIENAASVVDFKIDPANKVNEAELSSYLPKFNQFFDTDNRKKRAASFEENLSTVSDFDRLKNIIILYVRNNLSQLLQDNESMKALKSIYNILKPKISFSSWFYNNFDNIQEDDMIKFASNQTPSMKKIKCIMDKKCSARHSIKENAFLKITLQRQAKKIMMTIIFNVYKSRLDPSSTHIWKREAESTISSHMVEHTTLAPPSSSLLAYGPPVSPTHAIYYALNMSGGHVIHTRALPLLPILGTLAFGTGAANVGHSLITGGAPLSWFGKPMGKLFGFATEEQLSALNEKLNTHATSISNLHLDNVETRKTVNEVIDTQERMNKKISQAFKAATAVMLESDIRSYLRHLIALLETNSNKIVILGLAASTGKTPASALSQQELSDIADRALKEKGIKLSTDLSLVKLSMLKVDSKLTLVFDIPIIVEENLYHFYKVDAIPLFENNTMYLPELDAPYLGISKSGSSYITPTQEEFTRCTTDPSLCSISSLTNPMTSTAHCTVTTYITGNMTCALLESDKTPLRYIHIKGNKTIYSVPEETLVYIKCDDMKSPTHSREITFVMKHMGQVTFKPGCTINFPDGTKFKTPAYYEAETIDDSTLFHVLATYSIPKNARIKRFYSYDYRSIAKLETEDNYPTLAKLKEDIFHPTRALGFLVKFLVSLTFVFLIMFSCLCYWRPIRTCLGTSKIMFCFDPVDPEQIKDPLRKERLKGILKSTMSKAKSTSDLVLDNLHTRRKKLLRSRSAVTFTEQEKKKSVDDSSDDELVEFVTLPKDRVKMVYTKTGYGYDDQSNYQSASLKNFETN